MTRLEMRAFLRNEVRCHPEHKEVPEGDYLDILKLWPHVEWAFRLALVMFLAAVVALLV